MTNTNTNVKTSNSLVTRCTIDSKSLLARLLANENIVVEHVPGSDTAYFDTASRRLVLPVWKDMDNDTYDMLVGHEVGHAIYTPAGIEPLEKAINSIDSTNPDLVKGYLNIVEDARIERLMKRRYPGLTHNFRRAYTRMYEADQFGFRRNATDPSELGLIDRLNLRAKVGVHVDVDVPLDTMERLLFAEMMRTETFDEVVALTKRIYDHARKPKTQQPPVNVNLSPAGGQQDDMLDEDTASAPTSDDEGEGTPTTGTETVETKEPSSSTDNRGGGTVNGAVRTVGAPDAPITSNIHANAAPRDKSGKEIVYAEIGGREMLRDIVVDHRIVAADFAGLMIASTYDEFRSESRNYVNMLVKEFELRKAADLHARTAISTSGVIDADRLHQYKYVDDIFKRMSNVRQGKNHGMVMFLDWSSSMSIVLNNTVRQVMCLAWFCRACNIPFDVYAFSDNHHGVESRLNRQQPIPNDATITPQSFRLFNFLSSKMTTREFNRAMQVLFTLGTNGTYTANIPMHYHLNGTPLFATIVAARNIVDEFRERNNLQIVNTIILTDGDDTDGLHTRSGKFVGRDYGNVVVRDRATRAQVMMDSKDGVRERTGKLLQLLKFTTGTNIVGVYLINGGNGKNQLASLLNMNRYGNEFDAVVSRFRSQKYVEANNLGYDAFFVVPGAELDTRLDEKHDFKKKDLTKGRIAGAFLKANQAKNVNRVLLQRFIGFISR